MFDTTDFLSDLMLSKSQAGISDTDLIPILIVLIVNNNNEYILLI